jgi:hypothetical protein
MADRPPYPGTPRWVKVSGIVVIVLVLLVVVLHLAGAVRDHGPGRHMPAGGAGGDTPPAGVIEHRTPFGGVPAGHTPPIEHGVPQP